MNERIRKLLAKEGTSDTDLLSVSFGELSINTEIKNMADIARIEAQLMAIVSDNQRLIQRVGELEQNRTVFQNNTSVVEYEDIISTYTSGDGIKLDAFKILPEFNGDKKTYRSWRTQVSKLMKQISSFKTHPNYGSALAIIRAKITGIASDILINNNTAHNIDAVIDRLDFSYADQRPLYVIEAEMTMIKQRNKTLQEYYEELNQALNMVLTKITMSYKEVSEQKSLIAETQQKAIRTFITGINSTLIRTTLYGNMPKTLTQAFAIAQTIEYDNQHLQLDNQLKIKEQPREAEKNHFDNKPKFHPNFRYHSQQPIQASKQNIIPHYKQQPKQEPMEVDNSKQNARPPFQSFKPFSSNNRPFKRERDPSFQNVNKYQRVNNIRSIYQHDSMENNYDDTDDLDNQSTTSIQESIFLEE